MVDVMEERLKSDGLLMDEDEVCGYYGGGWRVIVWREVYGYFLLLKMMKDDGCWWERIWWISYDDDGSWTPPPFHIVHVFYL